MIPTDLYNQRAFIRHWAAVLKRNDDKTSFMAGAQFMLQMMAWDYAKHVHAYRAFQRMNSADWRRYVDIESRR